MGIIRLRIPLFLSIIVHFLGVLLFFILALRTPSFPPVQKIATIEIEIQRVEKAVEKNKNRIVQTEDAEAVNKPLENAFLGARDQITDRQTVSGNHRVEVGSVPRSTSSPLNKVNKNPAGKILSHLGLPLIPQGAFSKQLEPIWATPGFRPQDYINGIKESDRTALNTREYRFYGYFQRIRERLDHAWVPLLREKLMAYYRGGRKLATDMDHTTQLLVTLNDKGEIVRVKLVSESGTRDLDTAAIDAFNQAGPFPNPPKGMVDQNKEIQVPWDFILKT